jgi:hypothetical protein
MDTIVQSVAIEGQIQKGRFHGKKKKEGNGPLKPTEQG